MQRPWHTTRNLIGPIIEPFYRALVALRNTLFDRGRGVRRIGLPVISVGNLTTGGTGKTPLVMLIVRHLQAVGERPAIAMRGYKPSAAGQSDEAQEFAAALQGVPVIVGGDRFASVAMFLKVFDRDHGENAERPTCIVLDDGLQHRQLARDLDIVLMAADVDLTMERMLPTGDLREPLRGVSRARLIVMTHAGTRERELAEGTHWSKRVLAEANLAERVVLADHRWLGILDASGTLHEVSHLRAVPTFACCAIGRPESFLRQAAQHALLRGELALPDHDRYSQAMVKLIIQQAAAARASALLVTEKDFTKLQDRAAWLRSAGLTLYRAKLELEIVLGRELLHQAIEDALRAHRQPQ